MSLSLSNGPPSTGFSGGSTAVASTTTSRRRSQERHQIHGSPLVSTALQLRLTHLRAIKSLLLANDLSAAITLVNRVNNIGVSVDFLKLVTPTADQENRCYALQPKDLALVLPFLVSVFSQLVYEEHVVILLQVVRVLVKAFCDTLIDGEKKSKLIADSVQELRLQVSKLRQLSSNPSTSANSIPLLQKRALRELSAVYK
mmetsp:Transcript_51468/g.129131  ORF Transcript_51468/g.129131 Transcript_51468/m.129131 type:complete len:200 (+) Transcript_51468:96-695(+)